MLYFVIVPAFVLWLVVAILAVALTRTVPRLAHAFPYAWRIALWATLGFLGANALLILLLTGGFPALDKPSSEIAASGDAGRILWAAGAVAGPPVASATGWLFGGIVGVALSLRRRSSGRRTLQQDAA